MFPFSVPKEIAHAENSESDYLSHSHLKVKLDLMEYVKSLGHEVADLGSDDPIYANTAIEVAKAVAAKEAKPVVKKATTAKKTTKK